MSKRENRESLLMATRFAPSGALGSVGRFVQVIRRQSSIFSVSFLMMRRPLLQRAPELWEFGDDLRLPSSAWRFRAGHLTVARMTCIASPAIGGLVHVIEDIEQDPRALRWAHAYSQAQS